MTRYLGRNAILNTKDNEFNTVAISLVWLLRNLTFDGKVCLRSDKIAAFVKCHHPLPRQTIIENVPLCARISLHINKMNLSENVNYQPRSHPWQGSRLELILHKTPNIGRPTPNYKKTTTLYSYKFRHA